MFSLDGKIPSLEQVGAGRGPGGPFGAPAAVVAMPVTTRPPNADHGSDIYRQACLPCHGQTGGGGTGGGAPLIGGLEHDHVLTVVSAGKNNMPAFKSVYSADELNDVTSYILDVLTPKK
jgi:mono/diheme cytochrome c family protein